MKRGKNVLNRFAILVLFACFMYPSLLYQSITSFTTEEINSNHRSPARSNLMQPKQRGVVIHFLLAIYTFGALASICDDNFVPSLEQITNKLHMGSDVAGATFMAAGSPAPPLFASLIVRV